jgi:predicted pyridoxine 5'-phosphate oxidase superfamily flavin-nucleotide-binding protein
MPNRYLTETLTSSVLAAERARYGRSIDIEGTSDRDRLGDAEVEFIACRDSFYLATINQNGWPYLQHRGGPVGFLQVLDELTLGFANFRGNRQLLTEGNLADNDRASLLLMDYPRRQRLKILGHMRTTDAHGEPKLAERLCPTLELRRRAERLVLIDVVGFDWNCPAYITPRYSLDEIRDAIASGRLDKEIVGE